MKKSEIRRLAETWLKRARSNLLRAKGGRQSREIFYEDLCFDAQQAAEKAIKAVLILKEIEFPKTHSIEELFALLEINGVRLPNRLRLAAALTEYATLTRYPGYVEPVTLKEYRRAVRLAERVFSWAEKQLTKK